MSVVNIASGRSTGALPWLAVVLAIVCLFRPQQAQAWNGLAHRVIAVIAEERLSPEAAKAVRDMLADEGARHLADIASWADQQKADHQGPAHSIRLSLADDPFDPRACPGGFCATAGIELYERTLADKTASRQARLEALKYLVHLIADVHQPLHASANTGSGYQVIYEGKPTTLHKVWDAGFFPTATTDPAVLAGEVTSAAGQVRGGGSDRDWAIESRDIARRIFSELPANGRKPVPLAPDYRQTHWPVTAARMAQAGERTAETLNRLILGR